MNIVEQALYSTLVASSALTTALGGSAVYNQLAPQNSAYPLVTFMQMSGTDDNKSSHRARQLLYLVQGWSQVGMQQAGSIDAAIDAALHGAHLTISGYTNYWTVRELDLRITEVGKDSKVYYRSGGIYRLRIAQ